MRIVALVHRRLPLRVPARVVRVTSEIVEVRDRHGAAATFFRDTGEGVGAAHRWTIDPDALDALVLPEVAR